jgi:hypothetical protein
VVRHSPGFRRAGALWRVLKRHSWPALGLAGFLLMSKPVIELMLRQGQNCINYRLSPHPAPASAVELEHHRQ